MNCRVRARSLALSLGALGAVLAASCGSLPTEEQVNRDLYGNFQTAVASDRNYDIYWMGRGFPAGGLAYKGPDANLEPGIGDVAGGGLEMYYTPPADCGCPGLTLVLYSRPAYDLITSKRAAGAQARFQYKTVDVNGQHATLRTNFYSPGIVAARTLVVDYGKTVVEAVTGSAFPAPVKGRPTVAGGLLATAGPELNPLIDEATFIAVMQNLRPYPQ